MAVWRSNGSGVDFLSYHLDDTGHVMLLEPGTTRRGRSAGSSAYPVLEGLNDVELKPGVTCASPRLLSALRLLSAYGRSSMAGVATIETVDLGTGSALEVWTGQGSRIRFGLQDPEEQLRRWRLVHDYGRQLGRVIGTLDLSVNQNAPLAWQNTNAVSATPPPPTRNRKRNV
jgi:hypothetical protein